MAMKCHGADSRFLPISPEDCSKDEAHTNCQSKARRVLHASHTQHPFWARIWQSAHCPGPDPWSLGIPVSIDLKCLEVARPMEKMHKGNAGPPRHMSAIIIVCASCHPSQQTGCLLDEIRSYIESITHPAFTRAMAVTFPSGHLQAVSCCVELGLAGMPCEEQGMPAKAVPLSFQAGTPIRKNRFALKVLAMIEHVWKCQSKQILIQIDQGLLIE